MQVLAPLSIYTPANRRRLLIVAGLMMVLIAVIDWWTEPYMSLGFLYLFPIMIAGGFLSRTQIVGFAVLCAFLQEPFSNLPPGELWPLLVLSSAGFIGTGLFISELLRNRRMVLDHLNEVETQQRARREAEEQLQVLVESSPAAIATLDGDGTILLANEAAQEMLAPGGPPLRGQNSAAYLPTLYAAVTSDRKNFRTTLQCKGTRSDGEVFLAGVWFSTYASSSGIRLAAILVDLSEDLRSREDLNLDYLLTNTRILMSAVSHEIRNLCGAAMVVHRNLAKVRELHGNLDFEALGTLIHGLEQISAMELRGSTDQPRTASELTSVLDELRVLIDTAGHEHGITMHWEETGAVPLIWADRYGLMQVFLNLAKNSIRALEVLETQRLLTISTTVQQRFVAVRFEDSGTGIADPSNLFRPFCEDAQGSGLGLYVSRALVRSFGGDLVYEHRERGCCFAVVLERVSYAVESGDV